MACGEKTCSGGCDPDAACCVVCGLARVERALLRVGPPRTVEALDPSNAAPSKDWAATQGEAKCETRGATALWVNETGDVDLTTASGARVVLRNVLAGVWHPIPFAVKIHAQTTSAKGVILAW